MPKEEMTKYKDEFLSEAKEHLALMNTSLLSLEKEPDDSDSLDNIFRACHTLKSMAATMEYDQTSALCHTLEDTLSGIREKDVELDKFADTLFECFDTLELSLKNLSQDKQERDTAKLIERLKTLATTESAQDSTEAREIPAAGTEKIRAIEVKVEKLDKLMNLAEELVVNKLKLDKIKSSLGDPELSAVVDSLGRMIVDMQYNIVESRMVPVGYVFNRFPRMVRDLAKQQGKEIDLHTEGEDIELDRTVIDEIGQCLVHLLRNAVDHGLETPQERKQKGKPARGSIRLVASRTKDTVSIEIADDGQGLDYDQIKSTAVERGVLSPGATEKEIAAAIFSSVSTTKQVTAVSGRGFGLNIVRKKIEAIGGSISVESDAEKGTRFLIRVPLTLAVINALFVKVGGSMYAIPITDVERLVTIDKEAIKDVLDYRAVVLEGENIAVARLDLLFAEPSLELEKQPLVIVTRGQEKLGLAVDEPGTTQEVLIKPMNRIVSENRYFSGSTITGTGEVVLILDVSSLIRSEKTRGPAMDTAEAPLALASTGP